MQATDFDYDLPAGSIAQEAIEPRDGSRLLLTNPLEDRLFIDLPDILASGDLLVVNRTKVRAARLIGERLPGRGRTEVLLTQRVDPQRWRALLRPAAKLKAGSVVECGSITVTLLTDPDEGVATVSLDAKGDVEVAIATAGQVPLPPYFHGTISDPSRYQTIFATRVGSAAAPTAALHFTERVMAGLAARGVEVAEVELEVGLDTFRPMHDGNVEDHRIHTERIVVPQAAVEAVAATRDRGGRVVAVGTTVVRTLESAAGGDGRIGGFDGPTSLFIMPGYEPQVVDAMITNFHAPRTTLLVLLAALMGDTWRDAYQHALDSGYRFLSFGDAMYLEIER
ncbi:MAG: tRNA preQ1(34) S-adenosylmethionine ribosyltransferase-isomerase QueA [Actinomycetia bacterium]|nr:tRNA preQ1(34) S-adenosylmethionine ribosyltransferase-isomerase QueA [Actinomycetes bacterium]